MPVRSILHSAHARLKFLVANIEYLTIEIPLSNKSIFECQSLYLHTTCFYHNLSNSAAIGSNTEGVTFLDHPVGVHRGVFLHISTPWWYSCTVIQNFKIIVEDKTPEQPLNRSSLTIFF